jgi:hypothetical protein
VIVAAGLLVLVGLGLFVAGLLTEVTAFYWACVAACVVAAVVLYLARRRMAAPSPAPVPVGAAAVPTAGGGAAGRHAGATAASTSASTGTPAPAEQVAPTAAAAAGSSAVVSGPPAAVPDAAPADLTPARGEPSVAGRSSSPAAHRDAGEPPVEEVEVTDLLLVVDLRDEVLVIDEHPRYHVGGCRHLSGQETIPIPLDEARADGFTPCGTCRPDATLAERVRSRKS